MGHSVKFGGAGPAGTSTGGNLVLTIRLTGGESGTLVLGELLSPTLQCLHGFRLKASFQRTFWRPSAFVIAVALQALGEP